MSIGTPLKARLIRDAFVSEAVNHFLSVHGRHPDLALQVDRYQARPPHNGDNATPSVLVVTGVADRINALEAFLLAMTLPNDEEADECPESPF